MLDKLGFSDELLEDYLGYLFFNGRLIKLTDDTFFHHSSYRLAVDKLVGHFCQPSESDLR